MSKKLDEDRKVVKAKIRKLEAEEASIKAELSKYPPMPHDGATREEINLFGRREDVSRELAALIETYENLVLESTEMIIHGLAEDSKAVKWLTVWLVVLTAILSVGTILDVLSRLGLIK